AWPRKEPGTGSWPMAASLTNRNAKYWAISPSGSFTRAQRKASCRRASRCWQGKSGNAVFTVRDSLHACCSLIATRSGRFSTARNWRKAKPMSSSSFPINADTILVADASVVINLNATGRARDIIQAQPGSLVVTENAFAELSAGAKKGHDDHAQLQAL